MAPTMPGTNESTKRPAPARPLPPADVLAAARARLEAIDAVLLQHDALLDERDQLARMIKAAEKSPRRRRKRAAPVLKIAT
jgi:hypothetical protein